MCDNQSDMKVQLKDIIALSELKTWEEASAIDDGDSVYESMIAKWQKELDEILSVQSNEQTRLRKAYVDRMVSFSKLTIAVVVAIFALFLFIPMINSGLQWQEKQRAESYQRNIESGLFAFDARNQGSSKVKNAPDGVTLETLEYRSNSYYDGIVRYTLNLPKLPDGRVYAVAHELLNDGNVVSTGLFHTNNKESGLSRFEKEVKIKNPSLTLGWIRLSVRVVDVGSIPNKQ